MEKEKNLMLVGKKEDYEELIVLSDEDIVAELKKREFSDEDIELFMSLLDEDREILIEESKPEVTAKKIKVTIKKNRCKIDGYW